MAMREGTTTVDELRGLTLFDDLPNELLAWLIGAGTVREFDNNDVFIEPGMDADEMYIILDGAIRFRIAMPGQPVSVGMLEKGAATGLLPFSRMTKYPGRGVALGPLRLLVIHRERFHEMLSQSPELGKRLVGVMSDRVRSSEKAQQEREKLTALGKLSAGLAHELNNPSAAILRSADSLRQRLQTLTPLAGKLASCGLAAEHIEAAEQLRALARRRAGEVHLTPLERGECEEALGDWLQQHGVPEPWVLAETYVDAGLCEEHLAKWAGALPAASIPHVLEWVEASLAADKLVEEIADAGCRISELVAAVKAYSHMDRGGDKQPTDVRQGLDSTLRMLGHELKKHKLTVEKAYDTDLPKVNAHAGELNQVWTNLLDNAIDASPAGGRLRVEARREDGTVTVRIIDNGKGIPPEIRSRIFEPFFTTKPVGEGTGLGLDIVQRIVTQQHGGQVAVDSKPGETVFTVTLPV